MTSFRIAISPSRSSAARFIASTRQELIKALVQESAKRGLTQSDIAREIGVHRSVINRELRGYKDITLGRIGELAHALGRKPRLVLEHIPDRISGNIRQADVNQVVKLNTTSGKTVSVQQMVKFSNVAA